MLSPSTLTLQKAKILNNHNVIIKGIKYPTSLFIRARLAPHIQMCLLAVSYIPSWAGGAHISHRRLTSEKRRCSLKDETPVSSLPGDNPSWLVWPFHTCVHEVDVINMWLPELTFLVWRWRVQDPASRVRTWPGEVLTATLPHVFCLWLLHHQWLLLDLDQAVPREEAGVDGVHNPQWRSFLQPIN